MRLLKLRTQQAAVHQRIICMALPGHRYACPWAEPGKIHSHSKYLSGASIYRDNAYSVRYGTSYI